MLIEILIFFIAFIAAYVLIAWYTIGFGDAVFFDTFKADVPLPNIPKVKE